MRRFLLAACSLVFLAAASGCGPVDDYVVVHSTTLTHELGSAGHLVVRNRFGPIRVVPCDGDVVTVKADFKVPESRREQLAGVGTSDIEVGMRSFAAVYGQQGDDLVIECGQDDSPLASGVVAELEIRAPATVPWHVAGNAGAIFVEGKGNEISIDADLGTIELTGSAGKIRLNSTVSTVKVDVESLTGGHIEARGDDVSLRVTREGPSEDLTILTLDGGVAMELPKSLTAKVQLRSSLGEVEVSGASGVTVKPERKGHSAEGVIGAAGGKLRVTAEAGDVILRVAE